MIEQHSQFNSTTMNFNQKNSMKESGGFNISTYNHSLEKRLMDKRGTSQRQSMIFNNNGGFHL
jgi:hypothetical protein